MNEKMNEKINIIIEKIKILTLIEISELIKEMEKVFNIDINASIGSNINSSLNTVNQNRTEIIEEKTTFTVILNEVPTDKKIAILKIVRNVTGLGLKESKEIVDNVPKNIKEGISKEEAEVLKKDFENAGAKIIIK